MTRTNDESYRFFDAERHFSEPDDCWTRHLESRFADRAVHVRREPDGRGNWFFGDRPLTRAREATVDMMIPGSYGLMARGAEERKEPGDGDAIDAFLPEFTNVETFLGVMDEQNVEAALVMGGETLNVPYDLRHDIDAAHANVRAYNRWIEEDWGFARENRVFGVPLMLLFDPAQGVAELQRVLDAGARAVLLNIGPVLGKSPADRAFDHFWSLVNEAAVPVVFHIDYFGYHDFFSSAWGEVAEPTSVAEINAFQWLTCAGMRPMMDMVASLVLHNLFGRYPSVNIMSLSNGSAWIRDLQRLDPFCDAGFPWGQEPSTWWRGGRLSALPSEIIAEHLYVAPFVWDSMEEVCQYVNPARIVMASDYPHPDGFADARDYSVLVKGLEPGDRQGIMRDNLRQLIVRDR